MEQAFGCGTHEELFDASNGLMLRDYTEKGFAQHLLVFMPVPGECRQHSLKTADASSGSIGRRQIRFVDDDTEKTIPTMDSRTLAFGDIDRTELVFKASHRPNRGACTSVTSLHCCGLDVAGGSFRGQLEPLAVISEKTCCGH